MAAAEAIEAGFREHDRIVFAALDLAQAGVDIAAKIADVEIRADVPQLGLAAKTAGANPGTLPQVRKRGTVAGDKAVSHILTAADCGKREVGRHLRGNVLNAVDGDVDGLFEQRVFQFFDEDPLAADLRERRLLELVAGGFDDDDFAFDAGDLKDLLAYEFGLPFRQQAAARANAERSHGFSRLDKNKSRRASTF